MSKFCMNCGKQIDDNANNCMYCGAPQTGNPAVFQQQFQNGSNMPQQKGGIAAKTKGLKGNPGLLAAIIGGGVAVIAGIVILFIFIFGSSYETPIENLVKAWNKGDSKYLEDVLPDCILNSDRYDDESMDRTLGNIADNISDIEYEIIDKEELENDDLENAEEQLSRSYDESVTIKEGYEVEVKYTYNRSDRDEEDTTKKTYRVYKVDGKWSLIDLSDIEF